LILFLGISIPLSFSTVPFSYSQITQNHVIRSTVKDQKTSESLPVVNVYLSETTIGTTTNSERAFQLSTDFTRGFKLVVRLVDYQSKTVQIFLEWAGNEEPMEIEFCLERS
jgi:hypothetical protein